MDTLRTFTQNQLLPLIRRWALFVLMGAAVTWLAAPISLAMTAPSQGKTGVSATAPPIPGTLISCLDEKSGRFTERISPANCDVAGYEGKKGHQWAKTPVRGIAWEEWGIFNSRGRKGVDIRNGAEIRLFVFRRIRCNDGRVFYSDAYVTSLRSGHYFFIRLPICGESVPRS
jgi:hypothetical protein